MNGRVQTQDAGTVTLTQIVWENRRRAERLAISVPAHISSFDPKYRDLEEERTTLNVSRDGLYFISHLEHYYPGMRVLVTFPDASGTPVSKKYLGKVVRVEDLTDGCRGIAVQFLL